MQPDIKHKERAKKFDLSLIEYDGDEEVICEIRKHPFGLFVIYLTGFFITAVTLVAGVLGGVWLDQSGSSVPGVQNYSWVILAIGVVVTLFVIIMTFISGFLYTHDVMLITNEKIAETIYTTIFDRSVSQLSLGDVQDVTVVQKGIFSRIFHYGTMVIETAGEQNNYNFTFAPDPYNRSRDIIAAHELNIHNYGN